MSTEWINSTVKRLRPAKVYLKTDYKLHVTEESPRAEHCQAYALSSDETDFQATCTHQHSRAAFCLRMHHIRISQSVAAGTRLHKASARTPAIL